MHVMIRYLIRYSASLCRNIEQYISPRVLTSTNVSIKHIPQW